MQDKLIISSNKILLKYLPKTERNSSTPLYDAQTHQKWINVTKIYSDILLKSA
jgi:hypothetical protein